MAVPLYGLVRRLPDVQMPFESEAKFNRRMAKKHSLDIELECVFDHQLKNYGSPTDGGTCKIAMASGATAEYRAKVTKIWEGGTGQKSWRLEFLNYLPND